MTQINKEQLSKASKQLKRLQKNIDYDTRDYPIDYICQKFSSGNYFIPSYQRNKVWSEHSKVRLIESLLLGYAILAKSEDDSFMNKLKKSAPKWALNTLTSIVISLVS